MALRHSVCGVQGVLKFVGWLRAANEARLGVLEWVSAEIC